MIESFSPVIGHAPKLLILGSIPGVKSLQAVQYYAHPRNAFWPIMANFFAFDSTLAYSQKLDALVSNRIALWDVLARCVRPGSLDGDIQPSSIEVNAIDEVLQKHPTIHAILLNGGKAAKEFTRHYDKFCAEQSISYYSMPSTSPAYAAMTFEAKQRRWHQVLSEYFNRE